MLPGLLRLALEIWTVSEVAARVEITPRAVERGLLGEVEGWDTGALVRLARAVGVDPARALGGGALPVPRLVAYLREAPSGLSARDAVELRRALSRSAALREEGLRADLRFRPTSAPERRAFEAGYRAARRLRRDLGLEHGALVDLRGVVERRLGIVVVFAELASPRLEALAIADADGAAIVLNRGTPRPAALQRRSVAHELCHLLFDPRDDSPLVDVLEPEDSRPAVVYSGQRERREQRARAFAAELLVPSAVILARHPLLADGLEEAAGRVEAASAEFGAPWELTARHLGNIGVIGEPDAERLVARRHEVSGSLGLGEPAAWLWARQRVAEGELSEGRAREIFGADWEPSGATAG